MRVAEPRKAPVMFLMQLLRLQRVSRILAPDGAGVNRLAGINRHLNHPEMAPPAAPAHLARPAGAGTRWPKWGRITRRNPCAQLKRS